MNIIEWKQDKIKGILSTFDRIIIKGYSLQLSNIKQMGYFLSHNNVLLKDFGTYAENVTNSLCSHIESITSNNNRPYKFIYGNNEDKGNIARQILEENPIEEGLICILSNIEVCSTMNIFKNKFYQIHLKILKIHYIFFPFYRNYNKQAPKYHQYHFQHNLTQIK